MPPTSYGRTAQIILGWIQDFLPMQKGDGGNLDGAGRVPGRKEVFRKASLNRILETPV